MYSSSSKSVVQTQIEGLHKVAAAATRTEKPEFSSGIGTDWDSALVNLGSLLLEPNLNADDANTILTNLLSLSAHPDNSPIGRQTAIQNISLLRETIEKWFNGGWISQALLDEIVQMLELTAVQPTLSESQLNLAKGADDV